MFEVSSFKLIGSDIYRDDALYFKQLTGALSHVLPIMISVLVSKWVADAVGGKEGIYTVWIALRRYPWLPSEEYRDKGETAAELMTPVERLVLVDNRTCTLASLGTASFRVYAASC